MTETTKCPYCLGSGKEYSSGHMTVDGWQDADTCSRCYGTGESNKDSVTTASPGALNPKDSSKCPECGGEYDNHGHRITTVAEAEALLTLVKGTEPGSLNPTDSCSLDEMVGALVRDACSVVPVPKSEYRRRLWVFARAYAAEPNSLATGLNMAKHQSSTDSPETYSTGSDELETLLIVLQVETEHANHQQLVIDTARETVKAAIQTYATNQTIEVLEGLKDKSTDMSDHSSARWGISKEDIDQIIKELKERL